MRTFKMTMAYDGTDFAGWQWQPKLRTVQGEMQKTLAKITQEDVKCIASGRTDAGVHALGQVVSFVSATWLDPQVLCKALNAELPDDLLVFDIVEMPAGFHAIVDAVGKRYRYVIQDGRLPDIFNRRCAWQLYRRLDVAAMQAAAPALVGTHDFKSYQSRGSSRMTTVRTVYDISVVRQEGEFTDRIEIEVAANGFLYNMVRNIAGTLAYVGDGKFPVSWPGDILALRDRRKAGITAPAHGLFMVSVEYPPVEEIERSIAKSKSTRRMPSATNADADASADANAADDLAELE